MTVRTQKIFTAAILLAAAVQPLSAESPSTDPDTVSSIKPKADISGALLKTGSVLGAGILWYNLDNSNKRDQIFDVQDSLKERFTGFNSWRFDSNRFETNNIAHPVAGTVYYLTARTSGLGKPGSYLFAIGGSAAWEYLCEVQEVVSINDMIMTPFGGAAIGEPMYQMFSYIIKDKDKTDHSKNALRPYSGALPLFLGYKYNGDRYYLFSYEFESINRNSFASAPNYSGFTSDTLSSKVRIDTAFNSSNVDHFEFDAAATLAGYRLVRNNYSEDFTGGFVSGLSTSFSYETRRYGSFTDKLGIAHLLGLYTGSYIRKGEFYLMADTVLYADFSSTNSYGLRPYLNAGHTRTDIENQGAYEVSCNEYYYAVGPTLQARVSAGYGKNTLTLEGKLSYFKSIDTDGRCDRISATGRSFNLEDRRDMIRLSYAYQIADVAAVRAAVEGRRIWGRADGYSRAADEIGYEISIAYTGI